MVHEDLGFRMRFNDESGYRPTEAHRDAWTHLKSVEEISADRIKIKEGLESMAQTAYLICSYEVLFFFVRTQFIRTSGLETSNISGQSSYLVDLYIFPRLRFFHWSS